MFQLPASERMRVLVVEDEPLMADAIRDGLRPEAIAEDIAGDGDSALEPPNVNAHSGFGLGADDYLTKPFELGELVLTLRRLDRRRAHHRPPVREIAGLRVDPFRRGVHRDSRYVAHTRKQFAVLEVLISGDGGVVSAEGLLQQAWDEHADPFTNAVRISVSTVRKRLCEPWIIASVAGVGYRIDSQQESEPEGGDRG